MGGVGLRLERFKGLDPSMLAGFGACRLSFVSTVMLCASMGDTASASSVSLAVSSAVCACVAAFCFRRPSGLAASPCALRGALLVAFCAQVVGVLLVVSGASGRLDFGVLPGFALCGAGGSCAWILWTGRAALEREGHMVRTAAASFLLASAATLACVCAGLPLPAVVTALAAVSFATLWRKTFGDEEPGGVSAPDAEGDEAEGGMLGFHAISYGGRGIASILALLFTITLMQNLPTLGFFDPFLPEVATVACHLAGCLLLFSMVARQRRIGVVVVCRAVVPVIALSYLLISLLPDDWSAACAGLGQAAVTALELFLWVALMRFVAGREARSVQTMALGVAVASAARLVCTAFQTSLGDTAYVAVVSSPVFRLSMLVVLLIVVLYIMPTGWAYVEESRLETVSREDVFRNSCRELAESCMLTPREAEVFQLAALGFTQSAIAEKLSVTEGTVHVHVSRIYQKTGVHNRQELLDLVRG